jgi:hypothetical protein
MRAMQRRGLLTGWLSNGVLRLPTTPNHGVGIPVAFVVRAPLCILFRLLGVVVDPASPRCQAVFWDFGGLDFVWFWRVFGRCWG